MSSSYPPPSPPSRTPPLPPTLPPSDATMEQLEERFTKILTHIRRLELQRITNQRRKEEQQAGEKESSSSSASSSSSSHLFSSTKKTKEEEKQKQQEKKTSSASTSTGSSSSFSSSSSSLSPAAVIAALSSSKLIGDQNTPIDEDDDNDKTNVITPAEWALCYRVLEDYYNPRGVLWMTSGALLGAHSYASFTPLRARRLGRRLFSAFLCGAYAYEISWTFRERHPLNRFFRDLKTIDSQLLSLVPAVDASVTGYGDRRGVFVRFVDFLWLDNTFSILWKYVSLKGGMSKESKKWPRLFREQVYREHPDWYVGWYFRMRGGLLWPYI